MAAYGVHGAAESRGDRIVDALVDAGHTVTCLGLTKEGAPCHPLYLHASADPFIFHSPEGGAGEAQQ